MGDKFMHDVKLDVDLEARKLEASGHIFGLVQAPDKNSFDIVDKDGGDIDFEKIFDEKLIDGWSKAVEDLPDGTVVKLKGSVTLEMEVVVYGDKPKDKAVSAGVD